MAGGNNPWGGKIGGDGDGERPRGEKPKADKPLAADEGSLDAAPPASPEELQARVAELEAENERLRLQVKTLQELLAEQA